jgi:hypothetical protein
MGPICRTALPTPYGPSVFRLWCYTAERMVSAASGRQLDYPPMEGLIVHVCAESIMMRLEPDEFFVCARELMAFVPPVGTLVRITPYARRRFDGTRLDSVLSLAPGKGLIEARRPAPDVSELPIDRGEVECDYLSNLMEQIEKLPTRNGIRRIAQVLIDAGAGSAPIGIAGPSEADDYNEHPPALAFRVRTGKVNGSIQIEVDVGADLYRLVLYGPTLDVILRELDGVFFDDLAEIVESWVDDGTWKIAKVEVLKAAPGARGSAGRSH